MVFFLTDVNGFSYANYLAKYSLFFVVVAAFNTHLEDTHPKKNRGVKRVRIRMFLAQKHQINAQTKFNIVSFISCFMFGLFLIQSS